MHILYNQIQKVEAHSQSYPNSRILTDTSMLLGDDPIEVRKRFQIITIKPTPVPP